MNGFATAFHHNTKIVCENKRAELVAELHKENNRLVALGEFESEKQADLLQFIHELDVILNEYN